MFVPLRYVFFGASRRMRHQAPAQAILTLARTVQPRESRAPPANAVSFTRQLITIAFKYVNS